MAPGEPREDLGQPGLRKVGQHAEPHRAGEAGTAHRGDRLVVDRQQATGVAQHLLAGGVADLLDAAVLRRGDRVLHLHGFEHQKRVAFLDAGALGDQHLDHLARHRRRERAAALLLARRQLLLQ